MAVEDLEVVVVGVYVGDAASVEIVVLEVASFYLEVGHLEFDFWDEAVGDVCSLEEAFSVLVADVGVVLYVALSLCVELCIGDSVDA